MYLKCKISTECMCSNQVSYPVNQSVLNLFYVYRFKSTNFHSNSFDSGFRRVFIFYLS